MKESAGSVDDDDDADDDAKVMAESARVLCEGRRFSRQTCPVFNELSDSSGGGSGGDGA